MSEGSACEKLGNGGFMMRKVLFIATTVAALVAAFVVRRAGLRKTGVRDLPLPAKEALTQLGTLVREVREATFAAFSQHTDDAEFMKHEKTARAEFEKLQTALASVRDAIPSDLRESCDRFVELATEAQMQLMAFAINRKNRGTPDSAQEEEEAHDLKTFRTGVTELQSNLTSAFGAVGVNVT